MITDKHLEMCRRIAKHLTRRTPHLADEAESEAYLALGLAHHSWVKGGLAEGPGSSFEAYASVVVRRKVLDLVHSLPKGYRSHLLPKGFDRGDLPKVEPTDLDLLMQFTSEEDSVGWELEFEDEVLGRVGVFPDDIRGLLLSLYLNAGFRYTPENRSRLQRAKRHFNRVYGHE